MKLNAQEVRNRIGNWDAVLAGLAPELAAALSRKGRHVPCPVHGGRDGFRLFRDPSGHRRQDSGQVVEKANEMREGGSLPNNDPPFWWEGGKHGSATQAT